MNCAMLARRSCSRRNRQTLGSRRSRDQRARAGRSQIGLLGLWTRKLIDAYHFALNVCRGCKALPPMHQIGPPIDWVSHRAATRRLAFGGRKRLTVSLPTARRTAPRVLSVGLPAQVVPSAVVLASNIQEQGEILLQRLDHARFQNDFHPFTRARGCCPLHRAYIARIAGHQLARRCRSTTAPIEWVSRPNR